VGNSLEAWRRELDSYYAQMKDFVIADPAEIFTCIAGMTARASEIRSQIVRQENRILQGFRTKELDPFITECERQFKVWSRAFTVYQTEADQAGRL
jgi:hypothetical protein